MASWIRYAGRIMILDNSIGIGYDGLVGGFRPGLTTALTDAGIKSVYVGPNSDAYGAHRAVSGVSAYEQSSSVQSDCSTHRPRIAIIGYAENDIGGSPGQGRTPAQAITAVSSIIDWVQAGAPQALILVRTIVVPQNDSELPNYYSRRAYFEEYNSLLPATCTSQGVTCVNIGVPTTGDGLHPDDTATGYPSIATKIATAIIAAIPGAST